jgi:hypothetical protein
MAQTIVLKMPNDMKEIIEKFLKTVCGFTANAAKEIIKNQGYDDLDEFYLLNDKGADTLCSIVRKPHASASRSTSGQAISNLTQEHLKLVIFAMKHYKHMSCKIDLELLTKKDIIAFSRQRQMEISFKNKTKGFAQATFKDLAKTFEVVIKQLEHAVESQAFCLPMYPGRNSFRWMMMTTLRQNIRPWMPRQLLVHQSSKTMLPSQASLRQPLHCLSRTNPSATSSAH